MVQVSGFMRSCVAKSPQATRLVTGFRVQGLGFRVQGLGFRVQGLVLRFRV